LHIATYPLSFVKVIETGKYDTSLPLDFKIARIFGHPIEAIFQEP
jgi:putative transcriptional regulator